MSYQHDKVTCDIVKQWLFFEWLLKCFIFLFLSVKIFVYYDAFSFSFLFLYFPQFHVSFPVLHRRPCIKSYNIYNWTTKPRPEGTGILLYHNGIKLDIKLRYYYYNYFNYYYYFSSSSYYYSSFCYCYEYFLFYYYYLILFPFIVILILMSYS